MASPECDQIVIEDLREELNEIYTNYEEKHKIREAADAYHYTSLKGLTGILSSKHLLLTHYTELNDPREITFALQYIGDYVRTTQYQKAWDGLFESTFDLLNGKGKEFKMDFYLTSFSEEKDDLPMWCLYGDNAKGFSIEFDKAFFTPEDTPQDDLKSGKNLPLMSAKVSYVEKDKLPPDLEELIKQLLHCTGEFLSQYNEKNPNDSDTAHRLYLAPILHILTAMPRYKADGYQFESERRIWTASLTGKEDATALCAWKTYHPDSGKVVIKAPFNPQNIKKIWIGPAQKDFESARCALTNFLKDNGYDPEKIEIKKSKHAYRS